MIKMLVAGTTGLALAMPMAGPALASGDHSDEVKTQGACSGTSGWELKAERDDTGVKIEFAVDSRVPGQVWDYVISGPTGGIASGTATTDDEGEFEVQALTAGSVSDAFSALATTAGETCDSTVGAGSEDGDDDSADDRDDDSSEDVDEGQCSADSSIELTVKNAGQSRVATLSVKSSKAGQKWRYKIKRGKKLVHKGVKKTGKKASFKVKTRTAGTGTLTADAVRTDGTEDCTTDDQND